MPAIPGMEPPIQALCVAPFGMEEGTRRPARRAGVRPGRGRAGALPLLRLVGAPPGPGGYPARLLGAGRAAGAGRDRSHPARPGPHAGRGGARAAARRGSPKPARWNWKPCPVGEHRGRWKVEFDVRGQPAASPTACERALHRRHRPGHQPHRGRLCAARSGRGAMRRRSSCSRSTQLVGPGRGGRPPLLPSVRYHPAPGELGAGRSALPWAAAPQGAETHRCRDRAARDLGAQVPGRLVTSAKSWLSHPGVDRTARHPALGRADEASPKISPVRGQRQLSGPCASSLERTLPRCTAGRAGHRAHRARLVRRRRRAP